MTQWVTQRAILFGNCPMTDCYYEHCKMFLSALRTLIYYNSYIQSYTYIPITLFSPPPTKLTVHTCQRLRHTSYNTQLLQPQFFHSNRHIAHTLQSQVSFTSLYMHGYAYCYRLDTAPHFTPCSSVPLFLVVFHPCLPHPSYLWPFSYSQSLCSCCLLTT